MSDWCKHKNFAVKQSILFQKGCPNIIVKRTERSKVTTMLRRLSPMLFHGCFLVNTELTGSWCDSWQVYTKWRLHRIGNVITSCPWMWQEMSHISMSASVMAKLTVIIHSGCLTYWNAGGWADRQISSWTHQRVANMLCTINSHDFLAYSRPNLVTNVKPWINGWQCRSLFDGSLKCNKWISFHTSECRYWIAWRSGWTTMCTASRSEIIPFVWRRRACRRSPPPAYSTTSTTIVPSLNAASKGKMYSCCRCECTST